MEESQDIFEIRISFRLPKGAQIVQGEAKGAETERQPPQQNGHEHEEDYPPRPATPVKSPAEKEKHVSPLMQKLAKENPEFARIVAIQRKDRTDKERKYIDNEYAKAYYHATHPGSAEGAGNGQTKRAASRPTSRSPAPAKQPDKKKATAAEAMKAEADFNSNRENRRHKKHRSRWR